MGRIQCTLCGEILESKSTHDFVMCHCDNQTFVDGGNDYMRAGGKDLNAIKVLPTRPLPKKRLARKFANR
jgi:hypothetical protein